MSRARTGPTRAEIVSTAVVAVLVVLGLVALWPRSSPPGAPASAAAPVEAGAVVSDADLAPLRTAAALAPCPGPAGQAAAAGPLVGVTVPCLGAPGVVDVGQAFAGRAALLNVWASWCVPCRDELPALAEYAARPEAVPVLGVDVRDDPRAALTLLRELGVTIPSVTDPDGALRGALAVPPALPVTYVVRTDGTVVRVDPPTPFRSADEVAAAVERLR